MASHFVASTCRLDGDAFVSHLSWSKMDSIAAMAVSTVDEKERETHQILFINNAGELITNASITHDYEANVFEWQPNGRVLAIGWADGMVSCWNVDGRSRPTSTCSNSSQHTRGVTVITWSPNGKRLITGDKQGVLCVWAADSRGTMSPLRQYRKKGEISCAVFCSSMTPLPSTNATSTPSAGGLGAAIRQNMRNEAKAVCPPFFYGTDRGSVIFADDQGFCSDVQQLSSSIDTMLFYEERSRLIIVTRSLLLTQYQVAEDGKVARVMQVKLSVAGDVAEKGLRNVAWASPGLLCMATQEKMVRLLDLAADESYNLSLSALGGLVERSDKVISVAFGPLDRYLAVGTQGGVVGIWKFTGAARDVSGSRSVTASTSVEDWELHYKTLLNSTIHELCWQGNQGCLGAVTDDGVVILSETVMQSGMCGDLYVVQVSSHEVSVHVRDAVSGNPNSWIEHTGMLVRGLHVSNSCFVVWNGKSARTYHVDLQLLKCVVNESFDCAGTAICIADTTRIVEDTLFICEGSSVKISNFKGTTKGSISFSEGDGLPEVIDINGQFLGILSSKGVCKFFDVHAPTKPKPLGSAGHFEALPETGATSAPSETVPGLGFASNIVTNSNTANNSGLNKAKGKGTTGNTGQTPTATSAPTSSVRRVRVNADGTRMAILVDHVEGVLQVRRPHSILHVFDRNKGGILSFDFTNLKRCPSNIFWDFDDVRLLAVEATKNRAHSLVPSATSGGVSNGAEPTDSLRAAVEGESDSAEVEVYLFFATTENGLLMQDSFQRKLPYGNMLGINVPRLYFRDAGSEEESKENERDRRNASVSQAKVYSKVMRDFVGLDEASINETTRFALLDFSYNLTLGKLDEAYKAVKAVNSPSIWENMAHMCVKTKRLDVAEVCLGNMGHARGAAAVRVSKQEGDTIEATVGVLAVQLGLLDDAARLFREAQRWDLLNKLYQSAGIWDKAIKVATTHDRIHLKNTYHFYAKHLESIGEITEAIENYEQAGTSATEVPRMLFHLNRLDDLEDYIQRSSDATLLKWWAKYLEANERYDKAKKYYSKANDFLSLVRICCFKGDLDKAAQIVQESNDVAASYHLARQLENRGEFQEAVNYYAKSGCYNHSIRLTKAHGLDGELMRYALKSTKNLMLECGDYFEAKGEPDKAIQLYHKGGDLNRALDLCFRAGQEGSVLGQNKASAVNTNAAVFDMMNVIVSDLGAHSSPETLKKCAAFLVLHKQYARAVELLAMAKQYVEAIEMCLANRVTISEEMVTLMIPPQRPSEAAADTADVRNEDDGEGTQSMSAKIVTSSALPASTNAAKTQSQEVYMEPAARKAVLADIAKALKIQGSFILASKLYTQAGDRARAVKCLIRGGDTKAVIQFASISRNAEIYKLAANYLQQMNWRESVDIMKNIIAFYTKAKAFEQLAGFYDSCAQVEIDDYRDYEKAIGALRESLKHLAKAATRSAADMAARIEQRVALIERFVQVRRMAQKDPDTMVTICEGLLQEPMLEEAIRAGDCLAMLVEHFHSRGKMREAYACLKDFETRRIAPGPYVDNAVLTAIYRAVGAKVPQPQVQSIPQSTQFKEEEVEELPDSPGMKGSHANAVSQQRSQGGGGSTSQRSAPAPAAMNKPIANVKNHVSGPGPSNSSMQKRHSVDDEVDDDIAEELAEEVEDTPSPAYKQNQYRK